MTTGLQQESAKIYQFPVRARALANLRREQLHADMELSLPYVAASIDSGWYHEEAIQQATRLRQR